MTFAEFERISYAAAVKEEMEWHRWRTVIALHRNLNRTKSQPATMAEDVMQLPIIDGANKGRKLEAALRAKEVDFSAWDKITWHDGRRGKR
jgi:hypothetical protein